MVARLRRNSHVDRFWDWDREREFAREGFSGYQMRKDVRYFLAALCCSESRAGLYISSEPLSLSYEEGVTCLVSSDHRFLEDGLFRAHG